MTIEMIAFIFVCWVGFLFLHNLYSRTRRNIDVLELEENVDL